MSLALCLALQSCATITTSHCCDLLLIIIVIKLEAATMRSPKIIFVVAQLSLAVTQLLFSSVCAERIQCPSTTCFGSALLRSPVPSLLRFKMLQARTFFCL